jgi:hypothetical protein
MQTNEVRNGVILYPRASDGTITEAECCLDGWRRCRGLQLSMGMSARSVVRRI